MQLQPMDSRRYFMLPQAPEDAGYYTYGKLNGVPSKGASQYAHPSLMTAILRVEREWRQIDNRKFGVGDISLAGGTDHPDHGTHEQGIEVDLRPVRKDGKNLPCNWKNEKDYDFEATSKLIGLFFAYANVKLIYFNDARIPFVRHWSSHDDHFHVLIWS